MKTFLESIRRILYENEPAVLDFGPLPDQDTTIDPSYKHPKVISPNLTYVGQELKVLEPRIAKKQLDVLSSRLRTSLKNSFKTDITLGKIGEKEIRDFIKSAVKQRPALRPTNSLELFNTGFKGKDWTEMFGEFVKYYVYENYKMLWRRRNNEITMRDMLEKGLDPTQEEFVKFIIVPMVEDWKKKGFKGLESIFPFFKKYYKEEKNRVRTKRHKDKGRKR